MMQFKSKWRTLFLLLPAMYMSQTYQWQWAKQAGGEVGSVDPGFHYLQDESIRDIVVDNNNNMYYLASVWNQEQNLDGVPVDNYGIRDLLLFSTDCQGNVRWSTTLGGYGDSEHAWHIAVDNNGGLYMMFNAINQVEESYPTTYQPIHFDPNTIIPKIQLTYPYGTATDPGFKTSYLLKYNTNTGNLIWNKPLQGDVQMIPQNYSDNGIWYMDSNNNIHAILGFKAGTHLGGQITVPANYTSSYQYYLVKFNYDNGNMTPATPILLPVTGDISLGLYNGKLNLLYDETLNRYYLAGTRRISPGGPMSDFAYNNIPITNEAYLLALNGSNGAELWRKEIQGFSTPDDEIHSIIKDQSSSDIYISGRYFTMLGTTTFGSYTFPSAPYVQQAPFVMRLTADGVVQWSKIADGMTGVANSGYTFMKGEIVQNGNEIGFAHGSAGSTWGSYSLTRPSGDSADPILVRLNKDTGAVLGLGEVHSNYNMIDEFTSIAADKDGNYVLGGFFHQQLFTDPSDNVETMNINVSPYKSQNFFTKYAKSTCSQFSVEETSAQAGIKVFPNPVQDIVQIKSKDPLVSYEIYGVSGQLMKQGSLSSTQEQIIVSSLQTGVYYLKVKTKSAIVTEKIVKK